MQLKIKVARFLLRDGNKVGADVSPGRLEVYTYTDQQGQRFMPWHHFRPRGVSSAGSFQVAAFVRAYGRALAKTVGRAEKIDDAIIYMILILPTHRRACCLRI